MRLWIDTDVGDNPDDAVALLCAAAHPSVELVGVSTSGGRTEWRAEVVRELVDAEIVPGGEPDRLSARVRAARPDALLAIGPLTDVAALVALGVALPPVTAMGGALAPVLHRGAIRRTESNFAKDPAAAAIVVADIDACIVPLDVTVTMRLAPEEVHRMARAAPRLAPEFERWTVERDAPVVLHDPLALLVAIGEPFTAIETRHLVVDPRDGTLREAAEGREHRVAVAVDAPAAVDRVLGLVSGSTGPR